MITLLLGAPGAGKSYEAVVHHALSALKSGRKVITNLPLQVQNFEVLDPSYVDLIELHEPTVKNTRPFSTIEDYANPWRHPTTGAGPLYIIDEAHMAIPRSGSKLEVEEWFALHRHEAADVVLISQSYAKLSRTIVDLVQVVIRLRKNIVFGSQTTYLRKIQDGVRGAVIGTTTRRYNKAFFRLYQSHTKGGGKELMVADVKSIWRHPIFYCLVLVLGFMVYRVCTHQGSWLGVKSYTPVVAKSKPLPAVPPVLVAQTPQNAPKTASEPFAASSPAVVKPKLLGGRAHPFDGLDIGMVGFIKGPRGLFQLFTLSSAGSVVRTIDLAELTGAGYTFRPIESCVGEVAYPGSDFKQFVRCEGAPSSSSAPMVAFPKVKA